MGKLLRIVFISIFFFSIYHLARDILQILGAGSPFTNFLHRPHQWCSPYCNWVTIPLDLFGIVGGFVVIRRNKTGALGVLLLLTIPLWFLVFILP